MGHAYSSIIADVFARFKRLDEFNVMFLTGTDEHGLKIEREAKKNSQDPKKFCDEISLKFKNLTKTLNLSNDDFIRTTEKRHYKAVNEMWSRLVESNDIYLSKYSGWYQRLDARQCNSSGLSMTRSNGSSSVLTVKFSGSVDGATSPHA